MTSERTDEYQYVRVEFPNSERYVIDAAVIAEHRADIYAETDEEYEQEKALALSNEFELVDWASNNMDWADVADHAIQIPSASMSKEDVWVEADKEGLYSAPPALEEN